MKLIHHAYERIPMYREFYDSHGFQPLQVRNYEEIEKVPIIRRDIIQSYPLRKRVDARVSEKNIIKARTSGSTGEPMEMWMDRTESHIITLKVLRYFREWGYLPHFNTIRLWGGSEVKKSIIQKFGLLRAKDIEIVGRSDGATDDVLKNNCHVLYASRSSLEVFADELDKRKVEFRPRIVVSTGEMLMKEHRDRFREIFGCDTLNHYASEELGTIAWECPDQHHNLHIDMETVLISFRDIVAQSNGKMGSIILTNLESFTMPFIRYDQGDTILIPENDQCSCGRTLPILGQVFGRNEDVLDYDGRKYYWNFFYNIMENFLYIKKYRIVQTKKGTIEFRILLLQDNKEKREKCISDLNSVFKDHFSPVNIRFVDDFPLQPNRKFKVLEKET
jgi:phenylacetate-CoA ligase